jgi:hypothetical protein
VACPAMARTKQARACGAATCELRPSRLPLTIGLIWREWLKLGALAGKRHDECRIRAFRTTSRCGRGRVSRQTAGKRNSFPLTCEGRSHERGVEPSNTAAPDPRCGARAYPALIRSSADRTAQRGNTPFGPLRLLLRAGSARLLQAVWPLRATPQTRAWQRLACSTLRRMSSYRTSSEARKSDVVRRFQLTRSQTIVAKQSLVRLQHGR